MFGFFKKGGEIPEEQQRQQRGGSGGADAAGRRGRSPGVPRPGPGLSAGGAEHPGRHRGQRLRRRAQPGEKLWTASIGLTAWMEGGQP